MSGDVGLPGGDRSDEASEVGTGVSDGRSDAGGGCARVGGSVYPVVSPPLVHVEVAMMWCYSRHECK